MAQRAALGPWSAGALVAGSMLGIGIFIGPPQMAAALESPGWLIGLWLLGGVAALCGALSVAELGAMRPESGGDYVYLREAYGPGVAAAAGWLQIVVIFPGSVATMAAAAANYQLPVLIGDAARELPLPFGLSATAFWAAAIVVGLTALNHLGLLLSGRFQLVVTALPLALLVGLVAHVFWVGGAPGAGSAPAAASGAAPSASSLAAAYLPVYFAYAGWYAALYVAGEVRRPARNIPLALCVGTAAVTVLYLLLCAAFLALMPLQELAAAGEAGSETARRVAGTAGVTLVTSAIFLAILGSINGTVMTGARIVRAMAQRGDVPRAVGELDRRFATPARALWLQALWAGVLAASRRVDELLAWTTAAMLVTGVLTVLSASVLRRRDPERPRPYRIPLHPLPPLLYTVSSLAVLGILAWRGDASVWLALLWFGAVFGAYRLWRRA